MKRLQSDLARRIRERTEFGLQTGALQPIATRAVRMRDDGVNFLVRIAENLRRKDAARETGGPAGARRDPFLPYDENLFVADISPTHVALLNKFNVIAQHLLLVTREFEDQERLLNAGDFDALGACLQQLDGLGFYNGGAQAGASQTHKHLQLVPLPLAAPDAGAPIEACFDASPAGRITEQPRLPLRHAFVRLDPSQLGDLDAWSVRCQALYRDLARRLGVVGPSHSTPDTQVRAYNLLLTRCWMLMIPRTAETAAGISINALGFAGALFVRDAGQFALVQERKPFTLLQQVS